MDIRNNASIFCNNFLKPSDIEIFTNHCNFFYQGIFYCLARIFFPCLSHKCFQVCSIRVYRLCCHRFHKVLKCIILSNKVCFGIYFHYGCSFIILYNYGTKSFCSYSPCFLFCFCLSILSQKFYCGIHIAIGLI